MESEFVQSNEWEGRCRRDRDGQSAGVAEVTAQLQRLIREHAELRKENERLRAERDDANAKNNAERVIFSNKRENWRARRDYLEAVIVACFAAFVVLESQRSDPAPDAWKPTE